MATTMGIAAHCWRILNCCSPSHPAPLQVSHSATPLTLHDAPMPLCLVFLNPYVFCHVRRCGGVIGLRERAGLAQFPQSLPASPFSSAVYPTKHPEKASGVTNSWPRRELAGVAQRCARYGTLNDGSRARWRLNRPCCAQSREIAAFSVRHHSETEGTDGQAKSLRHPHHPR